MGPRVFCGAKQHLRTVLQGRCGGVAGEGVALRRYNGEGFRDRPGVPSVRSRFGEGDFVISLTGVLVLGDQIGQPERAMHMATTTKERIIF